MTFSSFFSRKPKVAPAPSESAVEQLARATREYRDAERTWSQAQRDVVRYRRADAVCIINGVALVHVNTMRNEDPELTRLCRIEQAAKADRNLKLRAMLQLQGKLVA